MFAERGSYILVEEYTYPTVLETGSPLGINFLGIRMDEDGLDPEHMDEILSNWDEKAREGKKPHLLYTIPTGQNPSGATLTLERHQGIYKIAQKHDVYLLEDDPYYFIQLQSSTTGQDKQSKQRPPNSHEEFVAGLVPSFLRLDTDGRVFRMDSFSKIIAPGSRIGWITASEQIIERLIRAHETSTQNPSGFSQMVLFKLLRENWGHAGLMDWLLYLQSEYTKRRDTLMAACETYLPRNVVSWKPPKAGFFVRKTIFTPD